MSLPSIAPASSLDIFKFYQDGAIYQATLYRGNILKFVKSYPLAFRSEAFRFSCQLGQKYKTLLSHDIDVFKIWVDVCCSEVDCSPEASLDLNHYLTDTGVAASKIVV